MTERAVHSPKEIQDKEKYGWSVDKEVTWPQVEPYTIAKLVGEAGTIHIDTKGHYHSFWHRQKLVNGQILTQIVHNGGREGFEDLTPVMHQHERVIFRYTGRKMIIPEEERQETPPEELQQESPTGYSLTFPGLTRGLARLEVELPAEQWLVGQWIETLQKLTRDLVQVKSHGELSQLRGKLVEVAAQLSNSTDPYKQLARQKLREVGRASNRVEMIRVTGEAEKRLLQRADKIVGVVVGTMNRYNELEKLQVGYTDLIKNVRNSLGELIRLYSRDYHEYQPGQRRRAFRAGLIILSSKVESLEQLKGEPYFSKAGQLRRAFGPMLTPELISEDRIEDQVLRRFLHKQAEEVDLWLERAKIGVDFSRFASA